MKPLLIILFLNSHLEVLQYSVGDTKTVAIYATSQVDSVIAGSKDYAKPIYIHYTYTVK